MQALQIFGQALDLQSTTKLLQNARKHQSVKVSNAA